MAFFFILGGFALSLGYFDKVSQPSFSYGNFVRRRCAKFFPLHWLCLFVAMPFALLSIIRNGASVIEMFAQLLPNALLLQSLIPIKGFYFSFNAVSWYLSDTMLFALVFPFIVKGLNRLGKNGKIAVLVAMLMAYSALVYLLPVENRHAILYISPLVRIVDFILGIYLYMLYKNIKWKVPSFIEKQERWSSFVNVLIFTFTVAISYVASDDTVLIAAVYWISVYILLIMSMLTSVSGGVKSTIL